MTREIESQLKQMFADVHGDLPAADFTPQVMSALLRPRRRERYLWSAATVAALAFLWFSFAYVEVGVGIVARFPRTLFAVVSESFDTLTHSPLLYVYGTALGGYVLLRLVRRLSQ